MTEWVFKSQPIMVGCWVITGSLRIYVTKTPNWLHKKMSKLFFGWDWKDGDFETQPRKANEK